MRSLPPFFLDPALARVLNAATAGVLTIPTPPRTDLLPLVTYAPPIAAPGTTAGPIADLLRLNTGVIPTAPASASRLGLLGGDPAGFPNGRRLFDDVTDVALRAVAGVLNPSFNKFPNNTLGDGVNVNDAPYRTSFPYLADAPSGRNHRHIDPGEPGCTAGAGAPCPTQLMRVRSAGAVLAVAAAVLAITSPARAEQALSPAEQRMAWAAKLIAAHPDDPQPHVDLGWALARRARETGDPAHYAKAQEEATRALALAPGNFEARKLEVWLLLGRHEFGPALAAAKALNQQAPDDVMVYGFLADANAELGEYKAAEDAAQWMLDMRPGNLSGLTRAAYLREIFGDLDGAIELYTAAFNRMALTEVEDRAWILSQVGHLYLSKGSTAEAGQALEQALALVPAYHYALGNLARVRLAEKRPGEAVKLLRQLCEAAPHAENVYALAEALHQAGSPEARAAYAEFERKALAESATRDNANRELVFYYVDRRPQGADARRIADIERSARHDVHTLDASAWALSAAGDHQKARIEIEQALAVGTRDAVMLYHAGVIASRLQDVAAAQRFLMQSLDVNPVSPVADEARTALGALSNTARSAHRIAAGVAR